MLRPYDFNEGLPPRIYRRPSEIRDDISKIRGEIKEIENMLTVKNLLMEIITEQAGLPAKWVPELEDAAAYARESLDKLTSFSTRLDELREELYDTRCAMGHRS